MLNAIHVLEQHYNVCLWTGSIYKKDICNKCSDSSLTCDPCNVNVVCCRLKIWAGRSCGRETFNLSHFTTWRPPWACIHMTWAWTTWVTWCVLFFVHDYLHAVASILHKFQFCFWHATLLYFHSSLVHPLIWLFSTSSVADTISPTVINIFTRIDFISLNNYAVSALPNRN